ncbi:MAG: Phosphoglucosamine mutase [Alphaproteobacteria bacterium MarineAlpha6_Bin6]|nr:phosphoglucosamine mutase [Pelagibacteraceae bacterium]PPR31930.1 MAG: Phosphoglucosamine mutase [Alphaproteobacteria bacterium MarineAlpha6_Bin6]PPR33077.1 MAG: Phosphoglucosamine mutase [Alphaproteobacteria bacterium MarineAlpha6_Bin5]|tara:strand:+ start:7104 stop:8432 length:1329 start_codon:yes stop_codon:yes gene_type:complete
MNKKIFGTDGIRSLSSDKIFSKLSLSALSKSIINNKKNFKIIIGRDTRESSKKIEKVFVNALKDNGANVFKAGLVPTPTISYLVEELNCDLGVVISASHNPYQYNGIKFFNKKGEKLTDFEEVRIQNNFFKFINKNLKQNKKGKINIINNSLMIYKNKFDKIIKKNNFPKKLKVVFDCANGSSYRIAKHIFSKIKIKPIYIKDKPNGKNINYKCGSLYPQSLVREVKKKSADFGISFDGDGDRIVCCDENGKLIDGDKILACLTEYFIYKKDLNINSVVGTLMSNQGFENFIKKVGLKFYRAKVGDKFVYELMKKKKSRLGGEQSGHIIISKFGPSGDGILIALYLIKIISEYNKQASKIFNIYDSYFQVQKNIRFKDSKYQKNIRINKLINAYNNSSNKDVRFLIRFSGTEPLIRILVEGKKRSVINKLSREIENKLKKIS